MKHCVLLVLFLCALVLPSFYCEPAMADYEEPLVPTITNMNYDLIGPNYDMYLHEAIIFIGIVTGGYIPYYYSWYVDGILVSTSQFITYTATQLGDHSVVFVVDDYGHAEAADTLLIHVYNPVVPVGTTTWGSIKSLFK